MPSGDAELEPKAHQDHAGKDDEEAEQLEQGQGRYAAQQL
jgi:hypothetical protein